MMTLDRILAAATLCGALFCVAPARAEISAYSNDAAPDRPVVILETNKLTDDGDPIRGVWERHSEEGGDVRVLNGEGGTSGDGRPSVVIDPAAREAVVTWSRQTTNGYDIVMSRFVAGHWTEPVAVAAGPADELDPRLVIAPADGTIYLLYWVNDAVPRVELRTTHDLTTWSAPETISGPAEPSARPHGVVTGGELLVAYELHAAGLGATPRQIVFARREGGSWNSQFVADTFHAEPNLPEIHAEGTRVWIEWVDGIGEMRWTARQDEGTWQSLELETFDGVLDREYHVRGRVEAAVRAAE